VAEDGTPVIVLVEDYRERADLARKLTEEARLFGIELVSFSRAADAEERLPLLAAVHNQAALLLVDSNQAASFGQWLDATREALPGFVRFIVVIVMRQDFPALAKGAPAFLSWAKALEIPRLVQESAIIPASEIEEEISRIKQVTGLSPGEYIDAWQRGTIPDTQRNTAWLNLAYAMTGRAST
jgi:hypothetical protein